MLVRQQACRLKSWIKSNLAPGHWPPGPARRGVTHVSDHKFRIGEQVEFIPGLSERLASPGIYEVVRQLPTSNGEFGYRIKSARTCTNGWLEKANSVTLRLGVNYPRPAYRVQ
jgi:hypothetical protein